MNIKDIDFKKYRMWFIPVAGFSLFWTIFGAITIDYRWWWLSFFSITLSSFTLELYKDKIIESTLIHQRVRYILGWISLISVLFIVFACFISLWWLFGGLIISFIIIGTWGSFSTDSEENLLPSREKKIISYSGLGFMLLLLGLFFIPSYIANNHKNPKDRFGTDPSAVLSYVLYEEGRPTNKEHVVPKSWFSNGDNTNYFNDYVNMINANKEANSARANLRLGNVRKSEANKVWDGNVLVGYKNDKYFMPLDKYKGDVARIVIYMYVTYKNDGLDERYINLSLMKKWSRQDPVDQKEKKRNNDILNQKGHNNKFVSNPWLIGFVI